MTSLITFFENNMVIVFFFYGLAFFSMGLAVWLEMGRSSEFHRTRALLFLAAFGLLHGLHEWVEVYGQIKAVTNSNPILMVWLDLFRAALLSLSFVMLMLFGLRFIFADEHSPDNGRRATLLWTAALSALWLLNVAVALWSHRPCAGECVTAIDVLSRYFLGIPAALLAAWALVLQRRDFIARGMTTCARDISWAALALLLYGVVGQFFTKPSFLFPSTIINGELFQQLFGVPVQLFRAVLAGAIAVFIIRALRAFEMERRQRFTAANEALLAAQRETLETQKRAQAETEALNEELKAREELRGELLRQVVTAQEAERQRIARELHDGIGQTLTALGLGLAAASATVQTNPEAGARQLNELKRMSTQMLQEMNELMAGLRPSTLTDLGLIPALRSQIQTFEKQSGAAVDFVVAGHEERIQPELETIIFRITQEALTNIAKHADAKRVSVRVGFSEDDIRLTVQDDGCGFDLDEALRPDPQRRWGLLGIQERVRLVRGDCRFESQPNAGTTIRACIPLNEETCQCLQ
jgi:signal transduction histidine kinase